jgi:hypothetical protein
MKLAKAPAEHVALIERIGSKIEGAAARPMFGYAAYTAGGRLAFGLFGEGMCMRLSATDRDAAMKLPGVTEFEMGPGRVAKDYVLLTKPFLKDDKKVAAWAKKAVAFTLSMPPKEKPAKKAKK